MSSMAVRIFDLTETQSSGLTVLDPAPLRRRDLRRTKRRYAALGIVALLAPFVGALCVLGATLAAQANEKPVDEKPDEALVAARHLLLTGKYAEATEAYAKLDEKHAVAAALGGLSPPPRRVATPAPAPAARMATRRTSPATPTTPCALPAASGGCDAPSVARRCQSASTLPAATASVRTKTATETMVI